MGKLTGGRENEEGKHKAPNHGPQLQPTTMRHSSTRAKKGYSRDGWMAGPTGVSHRAETRSAAPSFSCSTSRCLLLAPYITCTLPALHLPLKGWCLHQGGIKFHSTLIHLQSLLSHQEKLCLSHSPGFAFAVSQHCPSLCWVKLW